jgi:hypothetical protein
MWAIPTGILQAKKGEFHISSNAARRLSICHPILLRLQQLNTNRHEVSAEQTFPMEVSSL